MRVLICLALLMLSGCVFRDRANDYTEVQALTAIKVPGVLAKKNTHQYDLPKLGKSVEKAKAEADYVPPEFAVVKVQEGA